MKIVVSVKRVPDYETKIKLAADGTNILTEGIKWIANPFDEIAVEEALRIKEQGFAEEVVAVTIGSADAVTQLRYALAMGADRGIHVETDVVVDSHVAASILSAVILKESPSLVLLGKQSIDSDANQTAQIIAGQLGWPQACFASKITIVEKPIGNEVSGIVEVTREVDGGLETLRGSFPMVVSADLRLNEPRYASLPNIMKAKKKQVDVVSLKELGVEAKALVEIQKLFFPPKRQAGKKVDSVGELVNLLRNEAKVL
jgi:electron transfer flavoprotein beta subunit